MAATVHLPKVGMTMEEGTLVRWLVADGEHVGRGDVVFEMETEKVEMEVEADGEGVLRQLVAEGTTLQPGAIVGVLLAAGESEVPQSIRDQVAAQWKKVGDTAPEPAATPTGPAAIPATSSTTTDTTPQTGGRVLATPIARRLAREHGLDLARVTGTGPSGRITEADVRAHLDRAEGVAEGEAAELVPAGEVIPYRGRRKTIGDRMHQSLQSMAQLTLIGEVRVDEAMRMLHGLNREWRQDRVVATLTALVVKACGLALREHPRLNSRLASDAIVLEPEINVGFAIHLDDGLMVPVVRAADRKSLQEVARTIADANDRAKRGDLSVDDVTGGTFTVTSLESLDVDAFTPVVNPPQTAILGVGRVKEAPVVNAGRVEVGQITTLSLTFDHRVVDGEPASRFLTRIGELLSRPYVLM